MLSGHDPDMTHIVQKISHLKQNSYHLLGRFNSIKAEI